MRVLQSVGWYRCYPSRLQTLSMNAWSEKCAPLLERALNRYLAADPIATREALQPIAGKVIGVALTVPELQFFFFLKPDRVSVAAHDDSEPDTWIRGSIFDLARLSAKDYSGEQHGHVEISGDVQLGQQFQQLLNSIEFYWEELLVPIVGDVAAHMFRQGVDATAEFLSHCATSLSFSSSEFLREELKLTPSVDQLNAFIEGVENLRDAVERLAARLEQIEIQ